MWLVSPGGFYTSDARSRHRIGEVPWDFRGDTGSSGVSSLLPVARPEGLVLVIQDVILGSFTSLSKAASVYQLLGGVGSFGTVDVNLALLQLLRASFRTWRSRRAHCNPLCGELMLACF